jgi:DNA-binding CsgD family transcriptional regulator
VVAGSWARVRALERIGAVVSEPVDARRLRLHVLAVLREVIDFDAYVWLLTDPVTTVGAAPVADVPCLPELPALIKAKYATPVNRWTVLQLQKSPAGTLSDAVGGELDRSLMWREVLCRYGIGDMASAVFADQPPASGAATIVVTIEEASASERVELFGRALGLSAREYELIGLLATGNDTRSMAREMSLSEHTIQDHLKSIFAKTGAHDRVTLLSRALGTRLQTHS